MDLLPCLWIAVAGLSLLILQRWTHRHLHGLAFLITNTKDRAILLYAIALLPGVFLHEFSHWLAANLLGVKTGSFSLLPKHRAQGDIQLGAVEYYKPNSASTLRESIIGAAPMLVGSLAIFIIATRIFTVGGLAEAFVNGNIDNVAFAFRDFLATNDIWVWLYLLFAISNTMMPSSSDRKAWPLVMVILLALIIITLILGVAEPIWAEVSQPISSLAGFFGLALAVAVFLDLVMLPLIIVTEMIIARFRGVRLVLGE